MSITIAPYSENDIPAVKDFNRRLQAGGAPPDYVFSESHIPKWLPRTPDALIYNEFYLALQDGAVRGTYVLKHQSFSFYGHLRRVVYLHHPFSEGIIDKKYAQVGMQILMHVIRNHPLLFALGMGGYDRPLPRMLTALKWNHCLIPFFFRVIHPARFLRNMQVLRQSAGKRFLADAAAFTGAGWAGIKAVQTFRGLRQPSAKAHAVLVDQFEDWTNEIWEKCAPEFAMIAVRDADALRTLYPASNRNFIRLKVMTDTRTAGWAVVAKTQRQNHPQYGDLCVGAILDCLALPEDAPLVISAAVRVLEESGVDMITCNQSCRAWVNALNVCGFLKGPSNFIFAASKKLSELIDPFDQNVPLIHLTRGDGDNLLQYV
jgi:hypothetical protein